MAALERELSVKQQEAEQVLRSAVTVARRLYSDNRPQAALDQLKKALEVAGYARTSQAAIEARELRHEIEMALGVRRGEAETTIHQVERGVAIKVQEARLEAQTLLSKGKALYAAKEFPDCVETMERVLEIVRWSPSDLDLTGYAEQARAYMRSAEQQREEEARHRLKEKERKARSKALQDELQREGEERRRIQRLFHEAVSRYENRQYEKSMQLASKILELEPGHLLARQLLGDANETLHRTTESEYHRTKVEEWKGVLEDFAETEVPYNSDVTWPGASEWAAVSRRASRVGRADASAADEDPRNKRIKSELATKRVSIDYTDAPFKTVINYLKSQSGVNIVVDPEVLGELESSDTRVNLQVDEIPLQSALNILLDFTNLKSTFRNGVLFITKPERALGEGVLELHDILDITSKVSKFPGQTMELSSGTGGDDGGGLMFGDEGGEDAAPAPDELLELVKSSVAADSWDGGGRSIAMLGGQLLVKHTPEVQAEIRKLLGDLRQFSGVLVSVEARFLTVSDDFLEDFGFDFRGLGGQKGSAAFLDDVTVGPEDNAGGAFDNAANGNPTQPPSSGLFYNDNTDGDYRGRLEGIYDQPLGNVLTPSGGLNAQIAYLNDLQVNAILHAVRKTRRATLLTAPRLTAFNTQRANVTVQNQIAYIRDFEVEVAQSAAIADPIVGVVQDGVILDVTPTVSNDRKWITLELRPTVATLVRPIPTIMTNLGQAASTQVNIQLPELRLQGAETTVRVPDGGTVVIGGLKRIRDVDAQTEVPFLAHIPILNLLTSRKGRNIEKSNLIIMVNARVVDLASSEASRYK
jgi:general secretion pathway protein D